MPVLIELVKNEPEGFLVNPAIEVLASFRYRESVDGLIECFDATFEGKSDWRRAYTPQMFRDNIAESLRKLTGQPFLADKASWEKWWRENRNAYKE